MQPVLKLIQEIDIDYIHNAAKQAAHKEAIGLFEKVGDQYPCGFAWVKVYGVRSNSKLGKRMQELGFTKEGKALTLWNPGGLSVQSVDVKEAGARAYVYEIKNAGFSAYVQTRLD